MKSLLCFSLAACACLITHAARADIVVAPGANAAALGNGQSPNPLHFYGTGGGRYQQVYSSSLFSAFSTFESITDLSFRAKQPALGNFIGNSVTVSNVTITLSTTAKTDVATLDPTFANNIGANAQIVYTGSLTMTASAIGSTNIDYNIHFQTPFIYSKSAGNLLVDFLLPDNAVVSGNGSNSFSQFDTVTDAFPSADGIGSAFASSATATIGSNSTTGLVTKFTGTPAVGAPVPEPASLSLLGFSAAALLLRRKSRA